MVTVQVFCAAVSLVPLCSLERKWWDFGQIFEVGSSVPGHLIILLVSHQCHVTLKIAMTTGLLAPAAFCRGSDGTNRTVNKMEFSEKEKVHLAMCWLPNKV